MTHMKELTLESRIHLKDYIIIKHQGQWGGEEREGGNGGKGCEETL